MQRSFASLAATLALVVALAAAAAAALTLRGGARSAEAYGRLARSLLALGETLTAQEGKIIGGFLAEEPAGEQLLRSARNLALGSTLSMTAGAEAAARALFSGADPGDRERARGIIEELSRLPPLQQRLEADISAYVDGVGGGVWSPRDIADRRRQLRATMAEAREAAMNGLALLHGGWRAAVRDAEIRGEQQRARAGWLLLAALLSGVPGLLVVLRHWRGALAAVAAEREYANQAQTAKEASEAQLVSLRQSERRGTLDLALLRLEQRSLTESIRSSLIVCDNALGVRLLNRAAKTRFGLSDAAVGRALTDLAELCPLLDAIGGTEKVVELVDRAEALEAPEVRIQRGAEDYWLLVTLTPFVDEAGKTRGVIFIADDITQIVHSRERLMQTERLAAMGQLSAQVTHEIRNPLSTIALNADLLADEIDALSDRGGGEKAEAKHMLASIIREIERLTEVTEEYLKLARLKSPALHKEDLGLLVGELVSFMAEDFRRRGIEVRVALGEPGPEVMADAGQLRQAFMNILKNSVESMPAGGLLEVRTKIEDGQVWVEVCDDGVGIPEHVRARIFDPFYTTKDGGTGLGLPITHQIVAEHGGAVTCESTPGKGTTIRVSLPRAT